MDADVAEFLLTLLNNAPVEVRGAEVAKLADVYARAAGQIREAAGLES